MFRHRLFGFYRQEDIINIYHLACLRFGEELHLNCSPFIGFVHRMKGVFKRSPGIQDRSCKCTCEVLDFPVILLDAEPNNRILVPGIGRDIVGAPKCKGCALRYPVPFLDILGNTMVLVGAKTFDAERRIPGDFLLRGQGKDTDVTGTLMRPGVQGLFKAIIYNVFVIEPYPVDIHHNQLVIMAKIETEVINPAIPEATCIYILNKPLINDGNSETSGAMSPFNRKPIHGMLWFLLIALGAAPLHANGDTPDTAGIIRPGGCKEVGVKSPSRQIQQQRSVVDIKVGNSLRVKVPPALGIALCVELPVRVNVAPVVISFINDRLS